MCIWTSRKQFLQPVQFFFRSMSKNDEKWIFFQKNSSFFKSSNGHVECSFENPVRSLSKEPKIFQSKYENVMIFFRKNNFSSNCLFGHVEFNVEKLAKFFRSMSKNDGKKYVFPSIFSSKLSYGHVGCSFDKPIRKGLTKS